MKGISVGLFLVFSAGAWAGPNSEALYRSLPSAYDKVFVAAATTVTQRTFGGLMCQLTVPRPDDYKTRDYSCALDSSLLNAGALYENLLVNSQPSKNFGSRFQSKTVANLTCWAETLPSGKYSYSCYMRAD